MLDEQLAQVAAAIRPDNFASLLDALMREVIHEAFAEARADEGTVWLLDATGEHLVPAYNTGPHAERMVARVVSSEILIAYRSRRIASMSGGSRSRPVSSIQPP